MAWALRSNHDHVDVLARLDVAVTDVETVGEDEGVACLEVVLDGLLVNLGLNLIWNQDHDDVSLSRGISNVEDLEAFSFSLSAGLGALSKTNTDIHARITQRKRMSVALGTVTDNGYLLIAELAQICVFFVVHGGAHETIPYSLSSSRSKNFLGHLSAAMCRNSMPQIDAPARPKSSAKPDATATCVRVR